MLYGDSVYRQELLPVHSCIVGAVQEDGDEPVGAMEGDDVAGWRSANVGRDGERGWQLTIPSLEVDAAEGGSASASLPF
jgi:hypothetical protein